MHGVLKSVPSDFAVNELSLYEPTGEGEHLYLTVRKTNTSHEELIRRIAKGFGVKKRDIGVAGRKDLKAVTTQSVSIYLPGQHIEIPKEVDSIEILSSTRHSNKLRIGHLAGNRFLVRLREVGANDVPKIEERFNSSLKNGIPNAFGPQRFGNKGNNQILGAALLREDWEALIEELLKGNERHNELASKGEFKLALDAWPFGHPAERNILERLSEGKSARQASTSVALPLQKLWMNAFQSDIFNSVLQKRVQLGTWNTVEEGDLVWNFDARGRSFIANAEDLQCEQFLNRIAEKRLSPTGPLWGEKMRMPSGEILEFEERVLASFCVKRDQFGSHKKMIKGARRPLRIPVEKGSFRVGCDAEGDFVELGFDLPAGSYATTLIDQLLADDE